MMDQAATVYVPGHHGGHPQSRLLQLPGEIRNIIHDCVTDDCAVYLFDVHPWHFRNGLPWAKLSRQGLGLTQVCRQIRCETFPSYRHRFRPLLLLLSSNLFHYVNTVFSGPATTVGTIVLWRYKGLETHRHANLKHFIRLASSARDLKLEFIVIPIDPMHYNDGKVDKVDTLDKFFDPRNKEGMKRAAQICEDITFDVERRLHKIVLEVRAEYVETWMPARHGFGQRNEPEALEWLRGIGLVQDDMERFQRDLVVILTEEMRCLG